MTTFEFEAIGTHWRIDVYTQITQDEEESVLQKIKSRIEIFDLAYSRFRQDSLVTRMSHTAGEYIVPDDAEHMMSLYRVVYEVTGGAVTPLVGQVLSDAGYDAEYSFVEKEMSRAREWDDVLEYEHPKLVLKQPALLDFGAGGKGYLVDIISELLEQNGILEYCVDASGDMRHRHTIENLRVGLEHPDDPSQVLGVVVISNQSLCGSAGNRRRWGRFHHIIHPENLSSPDDMLAVWVTADSTILADLLTTALFFVPASVLQQKFNFEYLLLRPDYSIEKSEGFVAEVFIKE
ncbi:MAG: FAD:protein FMN transferase [Patescibacteria group bacterium]